MEKDKTLKKKKLTINKKNITKKNSQNNLKTKPLNLGEVFSKILLDNGIDVFFGVPSDLNMPILDGMISEPIKFINSRNELNASYISEGYARTKPFSFCVVGAMVGSLSGVNGFANSISEKNPVLMLTGGNNSNDILDGKLSHHTYFKSIEDQDMSYHIYKAICGEENSFIINSLNSQGVYNIINNISNSLSDFKSCYVQIPANLQKVNGRFDYSHLISKNLKNKVSTLDQYKFYNIVNNFLSKNFDNDIEKVKSLNPVFLFGSAYLHYSKYISLTDDDFYKLMDSINAKMFYTVDGKGIIDEQNKNLVGFYWGGVTEESKLKMFESSKLLVYIGVEFSDYTSSGYTCLYEPHYAINCKNISSKNNQPGKLNNFKLSNISKTFISSVQDILDANCDIFAETGSSWFYGVHLKLPTGCRYNISIKYGSIGWCFPASIGNALANPTRKTICLTGDGALQCVIQEISTAAIHNVNLTLVLINNNVYQIENVLDIEEYNDLPEYDYESIAKGMKCKSVTTCNIDNFGSVLKKYNSMQGFNMIVLKISDKEVDKLMENWAKLVAKYTVHTK